MSKETLARGCLPSATDRRTETGLRGDVPIYVQRRFCLVGRCELDNARNLLKNVPASIQPCVAVLLPERSIFRGLNAVAAHLSPP
jgi:hypothetical protein